MKPVAFKESDAVLLRPKDMTDDECAPLPIFRARGMMEGVLISCWKPSLKDIVRIILHRKIWVWVRSGTTQPPIALETDNPFPTRKP